MTLVEVLMAVVLLAIGLAGMLSAISAGSRVNIQATQRAHASFLAQEIREWSIRLPMVDPDGDQADDFDDIWDLESVTFTPPRDGQGNVIADPALTGWSQRVSVELRDKADVRSPQVIVDPQEPVFPLIYVNVEILDRDEIIFRTGWLASLSQRSMGGGS
jgi:Tfp pilus assembly protein PilV